MLVIKNLYKEKKNQAVKDLTLSLTAGSSVSIECSNDVSTLLLDLILAKEVPAKGDIYLGGIMNTDYIKKYRGQIGFIPREDGFYENMTITEYIKLFSELMESKMSYTEIMLKTAIFDIGNLKIKDLTYSQKRRLSLARERLKRPKILFFQEPIQNLDREDAKIIIENIDELCMEGCAVLITSVYFRDTILAGERAYRLDGDGLTELYQKDEADMQKENTSNQSEDKAIENIVYKVDKIPSKVDDKILLFDPIEIDFVECQQGINFLYIRGEKFPCNISLLELEERLKNFGFFRCHRSYLVNLQRVREVITWSRNSYSLNLDDKIKSSIPLAKGRLEDLKVILKLDSVR